MSRFVASLITDFFSRVLLVRHRSRAWELPGGHIEPRESLGAAARRECEEEAGVFPQLAARPRRVIGDCAVFFGVSEYDPEPGDPAIAEALWLTREEVRGLTLSDLPSAEVLREWAGLERAPAAVESAYYDILAAAVRAAHGLPRTATVGEMAAAVGRAQEGADNLDAAAVRAREAYLSVLECDWRRPMADNERATWRRVALAARGGMAPTAPLPEAHPAPPPGFAGSRGRVLGEAVDGAHVVRLVEYTFGDNSRVPYVELHETHDGARPGRVMALSALVHLAQNVGDNEAWQIGNREGPPPETVPLPEDVRAAAESDAAIDDAVINGLGSEDEMMIFPGTPRHATAEVAYKGGNKGGTFMNVKIYPVREVTEDARAKAIAAAKARATANKPAPSPFGPAPAGRGTAVRPPAPAR